MENKRIGGIDLLRGVAIFVMLAANSSPYLLQEPYPYLFRFVYSLAAPVFIFLSGFSLAYSLMMKSSFSKKVYQAFYLLFSAALLDTFVWKIQPFQSFDVLYMIAIGMFVNLLFFRLHYRWTIAVLPLIAFLSYFFQKYSNYRFQINETQINDIMLRKQIPISIIDVKSMFIDGWFPLFPWLIFSLLGSIIARFFDWFKQQKKAILFISAGCFVVASFLLNKEKSSQGLRDGYLELFYPASIIYLATALSFVIFSFSAIKFHFQSSNIIARSLKLLGKSSLFVYLFHACIISYVFDSYFEPRGAMFFICMMVLFFFSCLLLAFWAQKLKSNETFMRLPLSIRSIVGLK